MRHKFLKVAALFVASAFTMNMGAQTDVTSQYLTNAGFDDETSFVTNGVCTYAKDVTANGTTLSQMQPVNGWTFGVENGDARASGAFAWGAEYFLGGTDKSTGLSYKIPATDESGNTAGGALGICAVWDAVLYYYQEVELLPGAYEFTYCVYNSDVDNTADGNVNANLFGFVPESGTSYYGTKKTFSKNSWTKETISFTLTTKTKGKISVGIDAANAGSGSSPHLFVDKVTLTYTDLLAAAKSQLEAEIATAKEAAVPEEGKSILNAGIQAAESTLASATTEDELLQAATALRVSVNKAKLVGASYATPSTELLVNGSFDTPDAGWKLTNMGYQQNGERPTRYVEKWSGSALTGSGSATQTIKDLPAGAYRLTGFANANNENATNVSLAVNSTSYTVSGSWKLYDILYNHETDGDLTITFSYNNTNANWVCVDEFSLVYGGEYNAYAMAMYKVLWNNALTEATTTIKDAAYVNVIGEEKANLQNEIDKAEPTTVEDYKAAINAIQEKTETFKAAKTNYDRLAQDVAIAKALGVAEATADSYAATTTSTAALASTNDNGLNVVTYNHIKETLTDRVNLGAWTEDFDEDLDGEGYKAGGEKYFNEWNGGNVTRTAKQTVTLPAGEYAITSIGRGTQGVDAYLYYKIGDETTKTNFVMKGNRGLGVDTNGDANFTPATAENGITYNCNNEGYGWEYRFLSLKLETETEVEIGISATFTNTWVSFYAPVVLTDEASIKAVHLTTIESFLAEVPTGAMNSEIKSTLDEKVAAAKNATDQNTIDELATISGELRDAVLAAKPSAEAYKKLNDYITRAKDFDATSVAAYEQKYNKGEFVNDDVTTVQQELNVITYNAVANNFGNSVELGTWNSTGEGTKAADFNNEHWSGETRSYKNQDDSNGQGWNASAWNMQFDQEVVLPAGEYVFKVAGRKSEGATLELVVSMDETILGTVNDFPNGSTGLGINKNGAASFDTNDPAGFTRNEGTGFGWQWRFVKFTLAAKDTVKIAVNAKSESIHQWVSFGDYTLQMGDATYMEVYTPTYNAYLNEAKVLNEQAMGKEEKAALEKVIKENETVPTTPATLKAQSEALKAAIEAAKPSIEAYKKINDYITRAKDFDATAVAAYEQKYNSGEFVNADVATVQQELNVITYNAVANNFVNSVELGTWTKDGPTGEKNNQHWSGQTGVYLEQSDAAYGSESWEIKYSQDVVLPAGEYVFKVAGRKSANSTLSLEVSLGETTLSVSDFPATGSGLGINQNGAASFDANDEAGFANNNNGYGWQWRFVKFTLPAKDTVKIAVNANAKSKSQWISFCNYTLQVDNATYMAVYTPTYNAYLNEAKALNEQAMGKEEKAALEKVIKENETAPTTPATLKAQLDALKAAIETVKPSIDAYAWIYNSIANAKAFGIDASTYETKYNERAYTIAQADTVHQELNVATYAKVAADYNNEYALTGWSTDELGTTKGQHWSGHGDKEYYDTNGSNFARSTVKTVTLPKGSFVLKAAGRSSTAAKLTLDVNGTMVEFHAKGDVGYGIDTLGVANFSKKGIYANNNNGRGWEWQFAKFTLDDVTEVTLKATISAGEAWGWGSLSDVSLWMDDATFEGMRVAAKAELNAEITKAESLATTNVGNGAFQILTTDENLKTLKNAIATAKMLCESSEATTEMLLAAVPTLQQAEATYKSTISGAKLNAPDAGQKYSIVLTYKGWDYDGKAMTYIANDRNDAGLYNIKYAVEPNASYAQAFTFTPAESVTNGYYLSMTDVDGNERYISTGVEYGGQAAQIRTTINEEKALIVQVKATATEGVYNLWNTEAKNYLGSQDAGVYTVNSHIDFKLTPAEEAEVTVDITIGYATVILPFNAELPAGMSAYICTAEGEALTLSEVYSLEANTPYVIKGDGNFEFSGYGLAAKSTYEKGSLIGTYAEVNAPVGSYVLMQQDGLAAFYKVDEGMESKVDAYCCYLNVPAATAPMFSFERNGGATGIDNSQFTNGNSQLIIYDLMGRRVDTMVKGNMYIVNGRKVVMK